MKMVEIYLFAETLSVAGARCEISAEQAWSSQTASTSRAESTVKGIRNSDLKE